MQSSTHTSGPVDHGQTDVQTDVQISSDTDVRTDVQPDRVVVDVDKRTLVKWSEHIVKRAATEAYTAAVAESERQQQIRQAIEDERANKRNFNRMLTLVGALLIGLVVTYVLSHPAVLAAVGVAPTTAKMLAPYSFTITILLDSGLALYSYVRHY